MLDKLKRAIYGEISQEEIRKFTILAITFLFTIGTYWLLRPLKDSLFFDIVGKAYQPMAKIVSVFIVIPVVLVYSKLVDLFEKHKLFYIIGGFYTVIFLGITYLLGHPTIGLANTVESKHRIFGWFIYVAIESFGSVLIALFWSFVASITSSESAKKGFPFVIAGGQVGGIIGPMLAVNAQLIGRQNLFLIAAFLTMGMIFMVMYFMKVIPASLMVSGREDTSKEKAKTGFLEGLRLLVTRPYLFGIFAIVSLYEIVGTIIDYQMKVQGHAVYGRGEAFTAYLGKFGVATNVLALLMALLGTSYLMRKFGLVFCLLTFPITVGVALVALYYTSIVPGITAEALMWTTFCVMFIVKGLSYALNNPSKEMMYIPTSKDAKYKTKGWIDMFGSRSAKATGSVINSPLKGIMDTAGMSSFLMYGAIVSLGIVGIWVAFALFVGRKFVDLTSKNEIIE